MHFFRDRKDAGVQLALQLGEYAHRPDCLVLAIPRGGVPVGYEVATQLGLPLDVLVVRKIGVPGHEELAAGAIGPDGVVILNDTIADRLEKNELERVIAQERQELERREVEFRGANSPPLSEELPGKTVILVDDGLATGASMRAAIETVRHFNPRKIVVAVPVAPPSAIEELRHKSDHIVAVEVPGIFWSVGTFYHSFRQTSDSEVVQLLAKHHGRTVAARDRSADGIQDGPHIH
jgi:predicted phosphoribosyltransferase